MKGLKGKRLLAIAVSVAMFASGFGNAGIVHAEEPQGLDQTQKDLVWEVVEDEPIDAVEAALSSDQNEVEHTEELYTESDDVRVFIVFDGDSVVDAGYSTKEISDNEKAANLSEQIEQEQEEVIGDIESEVLGGKTLDKRYSFTILTNAISADVKYGQIADIESVDGVAGVYIVPVYELMDVSDKNTITSGDMVGSYNTWQSGYTGAGMRVAVIDTGIDADHPSFSGDAFMHSLEEVAAEGGKSVEDYDLLDTEEIAQSIEMLNANRMYKNSLTAEDVYINEKIAYAFNYVDENLDVTHDNDGQGDHGTHVAGIALANKYVPSQDGSFETQENGVVGIAPEAQLMVMKVFGTAGGAYSDDYMAAIEDAVVLGADAINLSLGSNNAGDTAASEEYINNIFDKLTESDTIVSISAGNAYYWSNYSQYGANLTTDVCVDTVGSPGSYKNAFTVASAVNSGYTGKAMILDDTISSFYQEGSSGYNQPFTTLDTTGNGTVYEYVLIPGAGTPENYENIDVKGKIVLVSRGEISFAEKHTNGANAGAAAVVVYNNQDGSIGMNLQGSNATIPCVSIYQADAIATMETATYNEELNIYTGTLKVLNKVMTDHNAPDGYTMSDFSSWGVPGDLALKPEITAPGGNIYSTLDNGQYGNMSGTSMAAPSVSGLSALVLQYIQENDLETKTGLNSRALGQSLLMSTAVPLTQKDGQFYSPRKQGAGLANIEYATKSPSYVLVGNKEGNDGKVKVEFGDDPNRTGNYSFDFTVYNMSDKAVYYTLDSTLLTESVVDEYFIANSSYVLDSKATFSSKNEVFIYDINGDGYVNIIDAKCLLSYVNKTMSSELVDTCQDDYDFNNDGVVDTCDAQMFLTAIVNWCTTQVNLTKKVLRVCDEATVTANISLSDKDKQYIDSNFANGMYVEGYVFLDGKIDMSIPMLGFYGNWTESSMFEPYDFFEYAHTGSTMPTYSGISMTNYLTYSFPGDSKKYYYASNMYEADDEYIADRNAISSESGATVGSFVYSLIRNAASVKATISNAETNEEYFSADKGSAIGAFYSSSQSQWANTSASCTLNWKGTDKEGNPLPDGTKVNITITALPSYYNDGKHTPAEGTKLSVPMTIDNTAPEAELTDIADGNITVKVKDNQYVAAVYVYDFDKETLLGSHAVNQKEKGVETELTFEYPETVFYVCVIDYAGNNVTYRVNMSNIEDTDVAEDITISDSEIKLLAGNSYRLKTIVSPISILDDTVTWSSEDESVAEVDENGIVTAVSEGSTIITATTNAVNKDGEHLSATCKVDVFTIDASFNAIVWDENGEVNFAEFNTKSLPDYTKLSDKQSVPFWSAAQTGYNKLLASTYNTSQDASDYYVVDTDDYSAQKLSTTLWSTDMAYGINTDTVFGTYAYFINVINPENGEILGQFNFSSKTGGAHFVGIAFAGTGVTSGMAVDYFYLVDEEGTLYMIMVTEDYRVGFATVGNLGVNTNGLWYYNSMYYDFETDMIYWAMFDKGSVVTVYGISLDFDASVNDYVPQVYALGQFADGVWPVAGLYMNIFADTEAEANSTFDELELCNVQFTESINTIDESVEVEEKFGMVNETVEEETTEEITTEEETTEEETTEEETTEEETTEEETTEEETTEEETTEEETTEEETTGEVTDEEETTMKDTTVESNSEASLSEEGKSDDEDAENDLMGEE